MKVLVIFLIALMASAQTKDGTYPRLDYTGTIAAITALPCTTGQRAFATNAAAGSNIYGCTATNTWTAQAGTGVSTVSWTGGLVSIASPTTTPAFTIAGTSGGVPYFNSATTWASSAALTANLPMIGGGAGAAPAVGTRSGNTTAFVTTTGTQTSGDCVKIDANGNHIAQGAACNAGTVTSVAESFTGGLISVAGSPITTTGTFALTVAGTSGGIPYFASGSTWASSAALTANLPVIGGGAGVAPSVGTRSGNTTAFVTTTGSQTSGNCVSIDASGNHIATGSPCGSGSGTVTTIATTSPITGGTITTTGTIACPTCLTTANLIPTSPNSSITIGNLGAAPTLDVSTSYLNGLYAQLAASNAFSNGVKNTMGLSSTTAGLRLTCGSDQSAPTAGDLNCTSAGVLGIYDGAAFRKMVSNSAGQDLTALSTGFAKVTTTTGAITTVATIPTADLAPSSLVRSCVVIVGDPGAASVALADDNDSPVACANNYGADWTITSVGCWADAGSPTVTPILTGGSGTSVLTGALTCGTASWAAGTVQGTAPVVHSFTGGATCSSTPCSIDANITTAGGTAKYIVMKIIGTL